MILALIVLTAFRWGRFEETFTSAQEAADPLASAARAGIALFASLQT
jgi:hypothetical protein